MLKTAISTVDKSHDHRQHGNVLKLPSKGHISILTDNDLRYIGARFASCLGF